ncbi:MAG: hypothetical protein ACD_73C00584G0001, partial [uncultured bacterium]
CGKIFFVVGGAIGGPPGALIGGTLGTAGGALGGSYFYDKVIKPQVNKIADHEVDANLNAIQEVNAEDPQLLQTRLSALVKDAQTRLTNHQLDPADEKAKKVLTLLENTKYILNGAGMKEKAVQFESQLQEIIKSVGIAKEAIAKVEGALDNAKTLESDVLIQELFRSTLEENRKGLEIAGRQDLIDALSAQPADLAPPAPEVPDIISVEGRYLNNDHKGWSQDCHAFITINFAQKTVTGTVSGYLTQGPSSRPFAVGGPIKGVAYVGNKEKGSFEGKVEVFYHNAKYGNLPPVDGSMIYPFSGTLEGGIVKASISECGSYEMKIRN